MIVKLARKHIIKVNIKVNQMGTTLTKYLMNEVTQNCCPDFHPGQERRNRSCTKIVQTGSCCSDYDIFIFENIGWNKRSIARINSRSGLNHSLKRIIFKGVLCIPIHQVLSVFIDWNGKSIQN